MRRVKIIYDNRDGVNLEVLVNEFVAPHKLITAQYFTSSQTDEALYYPGVLIVYEVEEENK